MNKIPVDLTTAKKSFWLFNQTLDINTKIMKPKYYWKKQQYSSAADSHRTVFFQISVMKG